MKAINIIPLLSILTICACSQNTPNFDKGEILKEGDIVINIGTYKNKVDEEYPKKLKADYISLAVKENRNNSESRIITIPVVRLHSLSDNPKDPVFLLDGGPGSSNMWTSLVKNMLWLLDDHDIVMVGYRGVDGSVKLESEAFEKALMVDSNAFSNEHFKKLGIVWKNELKRYKNEGIDIDGYNIVEVIEDIELTKKKLGYNKINLFGFSYGTRIAYIYGLRHPQSIHRSFIAGVSPPGHFVWNPETTDNILKKYERIWECDSSNLERSLNIIQTIQNVFAKLPVRWKKIHIDLGKVRVMMFQLLYSTSGAGQVFDAFISAENGDYSGLALLTMMYDVLPEMETIIWGDLFAKSFSADYQSGMDYGSAMDSKNNLLGAPMSKLFGLVGLSDWKINMIPMRYRKLDTSYVNTLMIGGNLDIATPLVNAQEMIKYLPNGHLTVVTDYGHHNFGSLLPNVAGKAMIKEFYLTGQVLDEDLKYIPANLGKPNFNPQKMGKTFYIIKRLGLLKIVVKLL